MNIPDEAVEAAARVLAETAVVDGPMEPGEVARLALEAAAPHMQPTPRRRDPGLIPYLMAKAWDEGEAAGQDNADSNRGYNIEHKANPYRSQP